MSGIEVTTSTEGLPVEVRVPAAELRFGAAHVAAEVLRQCRSAALAAGLARRAELEALGVAPSTLTQLGVPTVAEGAAGATSSAGALAAHRRLSGVVR